MPKLEVRGVDFNIRQELEYSSHCEDCRKNYPSSILWIYFGNGIFLDVYGTSVENMRKAGNALLEHADSLEKAQEESEACNN